MKPKTWKQLRIAAALASFAAAPAAIAQATSESAPSSTDPTPTATLATPDSKTMASYLQTTWRSYEKTLKGGATARDLPPTDCPPQPVQVCQDSWKIKTINPFE